MTRRTPPTTRGLRHWLRPDLGLGRNNGLLFWAHLVWGAGFALHLTIWTLFIESLGATPSQIGLVVSGGVIVRTLLVIPAGSIADRFSPKPMIMVGMASPVLAVLVLILATEWWHALGGAVLLEVSGVYAPAASAYIATGTRPEGRTRAYTYIYNLSFAVGAVIAPVTGGWLAEAFGFRVAWLLAGLLFAGGVLILLPLQNRRVRDQDGGEDHAHGSYRDLLRVPAIWVVGGFFLLVPLLPYVGTVLLPNFLVEERGLSIGTIGTLGSIGAAFGLAFGLLVSHWRPLSKPFLGMGVCLLAMVGAAALFLLSGALPVVVVAYMLRSSLSPVWSLMAAAVAEVTPERLRGRAYGLTELNAGLGDIGAPLLAGWLYGVNHFLPLWVAMMTTAPLAVGALLAHRLRDHLIPRTMSTMVSTSSVATRSD